MARGKRKWSRLHSLAALHVVLLANARAIPRLAVANRRANARRRSAAELPNPPIAQTGSAPNLEKLPRRIARIKQVGAPFVKNACLFKPKINKKSDGEFGHVDIVFFFNILVAMHKFVTERVMLV